MAATAVTDMSDLKDLSPLATRLKAATEELNQALSTIENRLNALGLGVEATLDSPLLELERWTDEEEDGRRAVNVVRLGYGRFNSAWALLAQTVKWYEHPEMTSESLESVAPLLRCSREWRSRAVVAIPDLIDAIKREAETLIDNVESAKRIADSLK